MGDLAIEGKTTSAYQLLNENVQIRPLRENKIFM